MKMFQMAALLSAVALAGVSVQAVAQTATVSNTQYVRGKTPTKPGNTTLPQGATVVKSCQQAGSGNATAC